MRVLVTTPPGLGHVHPMVPLAQALQQRGNEVQWATAPDARSWVEAAGLPWVKAGLESGAGIQEFWRRNPEARALPPDQVPNLMFSRMFGGIVAPVTFADLLSVVRDWHPQLVVHDAAELAGPALAAMVGAPSVCKSYGALLPQQRVAAATDQVAPIWRSVGPEPPPYAGCYEHLYLDIYPRGLQPPLPEYVGRAQPLRPVSQDVAAGAAATAVPLPQGSDDLPLVYLTMGTIFNDPAGLRRAVDAVSSLPVRLLVTVGPRGAPADIGDQPPNVRVERYVAQTLVLGRCQVVISHGGSGTVLATLAHGLPQLCLPQGADQFLNAKAIAAAGAGLSLLPADADAAAIAAAVTMLLVEPTFRENAGRYAEEIAAMPSADEVAADLERLPTQPRPTS